MTSPDPVITPADQDTPQPFLVGRFSLFETPSGGMHLVWRPDGGETDEHIDVPGWILKVARQNQGGPGGILGMLGSMTKRGGE